jgi:type IV pilus assembly protein PilB
VQCRIPFTEVGLTDINPEVADLIPGRIARKHVCVPIKSDAETITLAMANPMDLLAIEDIGHLTGRAVVPMVGRFADVENAVAKYYWEPE